MTDIINALRIESRREPHEPIWRDAIDEIEALRAEVEGLRQCAVTDDLQDLVSKALRKAWKLGKTYWQQVDSEYASQWKKSDATQVAFNELVENTRAALQSTKEQP